VSARSSARSGIRRAAAAPAATSTAAPAATSAAAPAATSAAAAAAASAAAATAAPAAASTSAATPASAAAPAPAATPASAPAATATVLLRRPAAARAGAVPHRHHLGSIHPRIGLGMLDRREIVRARAVDAHVAVGAIVGRPARLPCAGRRRRRAAGERSHQGRVCRNQPRPCPSRRCASHPLQLTAKYPLCERDEGIPLVHRLPLRHVDLLHLAGRGRLHGHLHLHRFEDDEHLPLGHGVSHLDLDLPNSSGDMRGRCRPWHGAPS
jgi:hypothetical protein